MGHDCLCCRVQVYPDKSLQDVMGQHQIQHVLASVRKAEAADPKTKVGLRAIKLKLVLRIVSSSSAAL